MAPRCWPRDLPRGLRLHASRRLHRGVRRTWLSNQCPSINQANTKQVPTRRSRVWRNRNLSLIRLPLGAPQGPSRVAGERMADGSDYIHPSICSCMTAARRASADSSRRHSFGAHFCAYLRNTDNGDRYSQVVARAGMRSLNEGQKITYEV